MEQTETQTQIDLYKLPKDMLIKLISTIREETQKEKDEQYSEILIPAFGSRPRTLPRWQSDFYFLLRKGSAICFAYWSLKM